MKKEGRDPMEQKPDESAGQTRNATSFLQQFSPIRWKGREVRRDTVVNVAIHVFMVLLLLGTLLYYTVLT